MPRQGDLHATTPNHEKKKRKGEKRHTSHNKEEYGGRVGGEEVKGTRGWKRRKGGGKGWSKVEREKEEGKKKVRARPLFFIPASCAAIPT